MNDLEFALDMQKKYSKEEQIEGLKFYKEIISDLENMEVPVSEILAKMENKTGRPRKEFEKDMRLSFASVFDECIKAIESIITNTQ